MQGYLFSKPLPFDPLCRLLADQAAEARAPLHA
jgi:EAL domain-containing protein (putative c-di-GMP-specific phosphodiesterase class I)